MEITLTLKDNINKKEFLFAPYGSHIVGQLGTEIIKIDLKIKNTKEDVDKAIESLETYRKSFL